MCRRLVVCLVALILLVPASGAVVAQATPPARREPVHERCVAVPQPLVVWVSLGILDETGASIGPAWMVKSDEFDNMWFLAADLAGSGLDGTDQVALWATSAPDENGSYAEHSGGLVLAVNDFALEFTDWPDASEQDVHLDDDGAELAIACAGATQPVPPYEAGEGDRDSDQPDAQAPAVQVSATCADFDAWEWAQSVFDSDPQAHDALDPDNDGMACPELPRGGFAPAFWTAAIPTDVQEVQLVRTIDGDTYEILIDGLSSPIELYWAETPETQGEQHCGGAGAAWFANYALSFNDTPGTVYLERDENIPDQYGRQLAYVWFEIAGVPYLLNHILINNGWAADVDTVDREYDQHFTEAAAFAQRHQLGVWEQCGAFGLPLPEAPAAAPQPTQVRDVPTEEPTAEMSTMEPTAEAPTMEPTAEMPTMDPTAVDPAG